MRKTQSGREVFLRTDTKGINSVISAATESAYWHLLDIVWVVCFINDFYLHIILEE